MALSDMAIRRAKPREMPYKLADGGGFYLQVQSSGGKLWWQKYRINGNERKLSIGLYPEINLGEARKWRDAAREQIVKGQDPSRERQKERLRAQALAACTFSLVAAEYCDKRKRDGYKPWAPATAERSEYLLGLLEASIGRLAVTDIEPIDVLTAVRWIERKSKLGSARRTLQLAVVVFRYAVATARLASDPTRDLRGALATPKVKHCEGIIEASRVGELLRAIDGYEGFGITKTALQIAQHVFVRPGELRHAEWSEIDLEAGLRTIPAEKMKMRKPHQSHCRGKQFICPKICARLPDLRAMPFLQFLQCAAGRGR